MSGSEPSREELLALVEAQARQIELLTAQVAELERRLGRNSRNSSQPPSADGPAASSRRSTRQRSGRKPGKQPGAGGTTLGLLADPDEIIDHLPVACGGCGAELGGAAEAVWCAAKSTTSPRSAREWWSIGCTGAAAAAGARPARTRQ